MSAIEDIECRLFRVPLPEVMADAMHGDHTHFELVTATVRLDDGIEGTGYTYTGGKGGRAIRAMIVHDLVPMLLGTSRTRSPVAVGTTRRRAGATAAPDTKPAASPRSRSRP